MFYFFNPLFKGSPFKFLHVGGKGGQRVLSIRFSMWVKYFDIKVHPIAPLTPPKPRAQTSNQASSVAVAEQYQTFSPVKGSSSGFSVTS